MFWPTLTPSYQHGLLPAALAATMQRVTAEGAACRAALQALPAGDTQKPVCRDLVTNTVRRDLPDEAHDYAYLQCDVHTEFILDFLLTRHGMAVPPAGFRVIEYSHFDHILGAASERLYSLSRDIVVEAEPVVLGLYNCTGEGVAGVHYEPVYWRHPVPSRPAAADGDAGSR